MRSDIAPGGVFPDYALPDHTAPPTLALTYAKPAALPGDGEPQRERVPPARLQRDE